MNSLSLNEVVDDAVVSVEDVDVEAAIPAKDNNKVLVQVQKVALFLKEIKENFPDVNLPDIHFPEFNINLADIHFPEFHINLAPPRLLMHQDDLDKFTKPERPTQNQEESMIEERVKNDEKTNKNEPTIVRRTLKRARSAQNFQEGVVEVVQGFKEYYKEIPVEVEQFIRDIVDLPRKIELKWGAICLLMIAFSVGSAFLVILPLFVPLNSVNDGLAANRIFLYVIMTYYELIFIIPWVETCNYAMPMAKITVKARVASVAIGVGIQKLFNCAVAEGLWIPGAQKTFPIPFSMILAGTIALPFTIGSLYLMTPNRNTKINREKWWLCCQSLLVIALSIVAAALWVVGIRQFRGTIWQKVWALLFGLFQLFFKILLASSAIKLNPYRFIPMQLVVDVIWTRFQVATYPFIDGLSLAFLLLGNLFSLFWRIYSGGDRLGIFFCSYRKKIVNGDDALTNAIQEDFGAQNFLQVLVGIANASVSDIHRLGALNANSAIFEEWAGGDFDSDRRTFNDDEEVESIDNTVIKGSNGLTALESIREESEEDLFALEEGDQYQPEEDFSVENAKDGPRVSLYMEPHVGRDALDIKSVSSFRVSQPDNQEQPLTEQNWEQRQLFHYVDFVGSEILSTFIILHNVLSTFLARNLPIRQHINDTFDVSDERFKFGIIFGCIFIAANLLIVACLTFVFHDLEKKGKTKWTMKRFISYIFGQNFWFLFLWLTATGTLSSVSLIKHFGADFTLQFKWLSCQGPGEMEWPGCLEDGV